jgi:uncharacterized protein (TIGR02117 family)
MESPPPPHPPAASRRVPPSPPRRGGEGWGRLPLFAALLLLAACAATPVAPYAGTAQKEETLYLIAGGWHTEIALSREAAQGLPQDLLARFPQARYLVFGWGARAYYTAADPGAGDALRALFPGPAVTLVIPLALSPHAAFSGNEVLALPVSKPGLARLDAYLAASFALEQGAPRPVAAGPEPGSLFFPSSERYDATHTCNTWTAEALHVAGLPIDPAGVVFAGQVMRQARPIAIGGGGAAR